MHNKTAGNTANRMFNAFLLFPVSPGSQSYDQCIRAVVAVAIINFRDRITAGRQTKHTRTGRLAEPYTAERISVTERECMQAQTVENDVAQHADQHVTRKCSAIHFLPEDNVADIGGATPAQVAVIAQTKALIQTPFATPDRMSGTAAAKRRCITPQIIFIRRYAPSTEITSALIIEIDEDDA